MEWLSPGLNLLTSLQYPIPTPPTTDSFHNSNYFLPGPLDLVTIAVHIAVLAILRDVFRLYVFEPVAVWKLTRDLKTKYARKAAIAKANGASNGFANGNGTANGHANGHSNGEANGNSNGHATGPVTPSQFKLTKKELKQVQRSVMRFSEQGWPVVYYIFIWAYGLYVHQNLPSQIIDPRPLWRDYPHIALAGPVKFYYLLQTANYIHQMLILNAEVRRKDHWQMMTHHIITVALLFLSFFTNFTRIGCLILLLMDFCDIFLPMAKMMRYLSLPQIYTDSTFAFFMVSWFITRHVLYPIVGWSGMRYLYDHVDFRWDAVNGVYLTFNAWLGFTLMLLTLEILQAIWFWMICRVAWRVVTGVGATDSRSDDECEDSDPKDN